MKNVLAMNAIRLGLLLVLVGFFAPIGCNSSGYQIAQGILGHAPHAGNARVLSSIGDLYGYALLGVFASALVGILCTFLFRVNGRHLLAFLFLALSLALLVIVALKLKTLRDSAGMKILLAIIPIKVTLAIGGYAMGTGYLAGAAGVLLRSWKAG